MVFRTVYTCYIWRQTYIAPTDSIFVMFFDNPSCFQVSQHVVSVKASSFLHYRYIYDLFVARNDSWMCNKTTHGSNEYNYYER